MGQQNVMYMGIDGDNQLERREHEPTRPLREATILDYLLTFVGTLAWTAAALVALLVFVVLIWGALQSPKAFGAIILRLVIVIGAAVFFLAVLNIGQKLAADRQDEKSRRLQAAIQDEVLKLLEAPGDPARRERVKKYFGHLDIIESVSRSQARVDQEILATFLRAEGADSAMEKQARHAREKWRRVQAVVLLGWLASPASLQLLFDAMHDPDPDIGYAACRALARFNDRNAYDSLLDALSDGRLAFSRVATFVEASVFSEPLPLLAEHIHDHRARTRYWIAYLVGRTHDPAAMALVTELAGDDVPRVRAAAAQALGEIKAPEASSKVRALLRDDDWLVKTKAAKAAAALADEALIDDVAGLLACREWWVRQNAVLALESIGPAAAPKLIELLGDNDRFVRNRAAETLGRLGVVSEKVAALQASAGEAAAARDLLVAVGRAEAVRIIEDEALRAQPPLKEQLIGILADIGDPRSLPMLEQLESADDEAVSRQARAAIEKIGKAA